MISIICRCFNVNKYINKCIQSILNQSYQNFEIVCVNDCSTDDTLDILQKYKDNRIKIISHNKNLGIGYASITGINNCNGDWISFVDPDDWIEKDFLYNLLNCAINTNSDVVGCSTLHYDSNYNTLTKYNWTYDSEMSYYDNDKRKYDKHGLTFNNKLIKSCLFNNIIFTPYKLYEDNCNMAKIMFKANKYTVIPYKGYNYLHRNNSLTSKGDNIIYRLLVYKDWLEYSQTENWLNFLDINYNILQSYKIYFNINKNKIQKEYPWEYNELLNFCKLC